MTLEEMKAENTDEDDEAGTIFEVENNEQALKS